MEVECSICTAYLLVALAARQRGTEKSLACLTSDKQGMSNWHISTSGFYAFNLF